MIHVVFNAPDADVLQKVFELDGGLAGNIIQIKDDYAVGPLAALDTTEGWQNRRNWWRSVLETAAEYDVEEMLDMVEDKMALHQLKKQLNENPGEQVWIWAGQTKHDVCGYYWLVGSLAEFQGRVFILYLNNLPFLNEKGGIFYPAWLSEIPPKEFLKARKLARAITPSEFEIDADEWRRLCSENSGVRLLEGGKKLSGHYETFYDDALVKYVTGDFQKASRILQHFLSKEKQTTGDVYLIWRLKYLMTQYPWELRGDSTKSSKEFELRNAELPATKKKSGDLEPDAIP